ncbi:MAG: PEP-CTERM sorting domain-containing protein [Opitutaceae bacterium]
MGGTTADIALIDLGAYDVNERHEAIVNGPGRVSYENGLHSILDYLQPADGPARAQHIFVANLIPFNVDNSVYDLSNKPPAVDIINQSIASVVGAHAGATLVDMYTGFDLEWASYDGIHPNADGATFMAERWFDAMESEGVLSPIPEPSTYAAMLGGASLLVAFGRRVRQRRGGRLAPEV